MSNFEDDLDGSQSKKNSREIINKINSMLGNSLNLSALNLERTPFEENEVIGEKACTAISNGNDNSYLRALLGLNNNSSDKSSNSSKHQSISSGIPHNVEGSDKTRLGGVRKMTENVRNDAHQQISENGPGPTRSKTESGSHLSMNETGSAPSMSGKVPMQEGVGYYGPTKETGFTWPVGGNGGTVSGRPRSVSFCGNAQPGFKGVGRQSPSPDYRRPHSSEAGSPTLEQALLMGHEPGSYRSSNSESQCNSFDDFTRAINSDGSWDNKAILKSEPRPTLASLHQIDLAVAHAVQNLQNLQEKRASVYANFGGFASPTSGQMVSPSQANSGDQNNNSDNNNNSFIPLSNVLSPSPNRQVANYNNNNTESKSWTRYNEPMSLEKAARAYRSAATVYDANYTWSGQLPPRARGAGRNPTYSSKIFLGGVPWDITEHTLVQAFFEFGQVRVEWPGRDAASPPRGYLYLVFEDEESVRELLTRCTYDYSNGGSYYYKISSRRMRSKEVQIIPWVITDSNFVRCPSPRLDSQMTVFVGALHGMINAEGLAIIFNDLFDGVIYAGLDTDKHKYPIGSGRVTFSNATSYMKAVAAAFIEVKTPRFCKKIQVDPYVEDSLCATCGTKQGPYFCRDMSCFKYFCKNCWEIYHTANRSHHIPMMRIIRSFSGRRHDNFRSSDFRQIQNQMSYTAKESNNVSYSAKESNNVSYSAKESNNVSYSARESHQVAPADPANVAGPQDEDISQRLDELSLDVFLRNVLGKGPKEDSNCNVLVKPATKETGI